MSFNYKEYAQKILKHESQCIEKSAHLLSKDFDKCIETLSTISGKLIICGIGKSGHIGKKIAATLASTGTPAFFLHATEAVHGDMGMIQPNDAIICISNSGKTPEVMDVAKFAKRLGITIVAMAGKDESPLQQISDFHINTSVDSEADHLNLVPTTSSTVCIALGDAIAATLMKIRNFSANDFANLHPKGSLGSKLTSAKSLTRMFDGQEWILESSSIEKLLKKMEQKNWGVAGVVDSNKKLIGCVSDGDIRRFLLQSNKNFWGLKAKDIMNPKPKVIQSDESIMQAIKLMEENKITSVFILEGNNPLGLLRLHDIMEAKII